MKNHCLTNSLYKVFMSFEIYILEYHYIDQDHLFTNNIFVIAIISSAHLLTIPRQKMNLINYKKKDQTRQNLSFYNLFVIKQKKITHIYLHTTSLFLYYILPNYHKSAKLNCISVTLYINL